MATYRLDFKYINNELQLSINKVVIPDRLWKYIKCSFGCSASVEKMQTDIFKLTGINSKHVTAFISLDGNECPERTKYTRSIYNPKDTRSIYNPKDTKPFTCYQFIHKLYKYANSRLETLSFILNGLSDQTSTLFKLKSNKLFDANILHYIVDFAGNRKVNKV